MIRITNNIQITNNIKIIDNINETLTLDHQHHSITDNKLKKQRTHMTVTVFNLAATYVKVYTTWRRAVQKARYLSYTGNNSIPVRFWPNRQTQALSIRNLECSITR